MQRVTPDIGDTFIPVEQALRGVFVPDIFQGLREVTPGRGVTRLHVKQAVLAFPDPKKTSPENWTASCVIAGHLGVVLRGQEKFRTAYHSAYLREGRAGVRKRSILREEEALLETLVGGGCPKRALLATVFKDRSMVDGAAVKRKQDSLFLRYGLKPPDLPKYCDGCNVNFSILP